MGTAGGMMEEGTRGQLSVPLCWTCLTYDLWSISHRSRVFIQLCFVLHLSPAVPEARCPHFLLHISWSLFQVFLGRPLPLRPHNIHCIAPAWQCCDRFFSMCDQANSIFLFSAAAALVLRQFSSTVASVQGEHKKVSPTTFVDISAMRGDFCMKFYGTVKQPNIHFITKFGWNLLESDKLMLFQPKQPLHFSAFWALSSTVVCWCLWK